MSDWHMIATDRRVVALDWDGDELVSGDHRWAPDGSANDPRIIRKAVFRPFDRTIAFDRFRVVYVERGTKALLYQDDKLIRELNRSYYHAGAFDYPVALGALPDGRVVVVHCPDAYNVLQVEDAATGERLTAGPREPTDIFHSRLAISPDGRHLLSAGWVWHPFGVAVVYDLVGALAESSPVDGAGVARPMTEGEEEIRSACWLDSDRLAVSAGDDDGNRPELLGVWSLSAGGWAHLTTVDHPVGVMVPIGDRLLSLYRWPRLVDPTAGTVLAEWPDVDAGVRNSSYGQDDRPNPVVAVHPDGDRVAIRQRGGIAILRLPPLTTMGKDAPP